MRKQKSSIKIAVLIDFSNLKDIKKQKFLRLLILKSNLISPFMHTEWFSSSTTVERSMMYQKSKSIILSFNSMPIFAWQLKFKLINPLQNDHTE
jgi:hypothetical protein